MVALGGDGLFSDPRGQHAAFRPRLEALAHPLPLTPSQVSPTPGDLASSPLAAMRTILVAAALAAVLLAAAPAVRAQEEATAAADSATQTFGKCSIANCKFCKYKWGGGQYCKMCNAGAQAAADGTCPLCPAGTYNPYAGSTCKACAAGYWSAAGSTSCNQCAPGFGYSTSTNKVKASKKAKPAHFGGDCWWKGGWWHQPVTRCTACAPGTFSPGGTATCQACPAGTWSGPAAATCYDINACDGFPCNNAGGAATCTDLPAPAPNSTAGRTCSCGAGYVYQSDAVGCVNVNACTDYPCTNGAGVATCTDLAPPAPNSAAGRTCSCGAGYAYVNDASGCQNINACVNHPCTNGAGVATCTDLAPPAPDSAAGRTCSCGAGFTYVNDAVGCQSTNINACTAFPCKNDGPGGAATCTDLPPPAGNNAAGRTCTCGAGNIYVDDATGCVSAGPPPEPATCDSQLDASGSEGDAVYKVPVGSDRYVPLVWNTVGVPDLITVYNGDAVDGTPVFRALAGSDYRCFPDDGTLTPSKGRVTLDMNACCGGAAAGGYLTVRIQSPCEGTQWYASMGCSTDDKEAADAYDFPNRAAVDAAVAAAGL